MHRAKSYFLEGLFTLASGPGPLFFISTTTVNELSGDPRVCKSKEDALIIFRGFISNMLYFQSFYIFNHFIHFSYNTYFEALPDVNGARYASQILIFRSMALSIVSRSVVKSTRAPK